jgi:dolichol-phosphate mannosyltransferase
MPEAAEIKPEIHITVVTPVYGCADCLMDLYRRLRQTLAPISECFEIIMVNDASPDNAWEVIKTLAGQDQRVKGIHFSRNFGQHYAITAGLDYARGEWVVVMDCDLQDQPEEIDKLYRKALTGFDAVVGRRYERMDHGLKKLSSKLFHLTLEYFTDKKSDASIANFGIYHRKLIENIKKIREQNRNFPLFVRWLGFRITEINIAHAPRAVGKSSYSLRKLFNLAIDSIMAQSNKPLRMFIKIGFALALLSFIYGSYLIARYLVLGTPVAGWTSVMVSLYFIGGLLLANMGMLGLYIGKIFDETKGRPLYVIQDELGFTPEYKKDSA